MNPQADWMSAIVWLLATSFSAIGVYFFLPRLLEQGLTATNQELGERIAKGSTPFIALLILLVGIDHALEALIVSETWSILLKLVLLASALVLGLRMAGKLRNEARDVPKTTESGPENKQ